MNNIIVHTTFKIPLLYLIQEWPGKKVKMEPWIELHAFNFLQLTSDTLKGLERV